MEGKKPNVLVFVIVGILVLGGAAAFFLLGGDDSVETDPTVSTQEIDIEVIEGSESGLNDELEDSFRLSDGFPSDLPLSGGTLTISTSDSINHSAQISVIASLQEAREWYSNALIENGWEIAEISEYDIPLDGPGGVPPENSPNEEYIPEDNLFNIIEMTFEKMDGERKGDLTITANPYSSTVNVHIREILMNL